MIKILDINLNRLGIIKNVITASRAEAINSENTLDFTAILDAKLNGLITEDSIFEIDNDYFDTACFKKMFNEDSTYTFEIESEHVSYRLNDPIYNVEYFTQYGYPADILGIILSGTGFTVGTVEFSSIVTYSAQEAKSRRQLLMEFAAYIDAECVFNKFEISFVAHRGSLTGKPVIKDRNVTVISKSIDKRTLNKEGNPSVSYICTPVYIPLDNYILGDNVLLRQNVLDIDEVLRVTRISRNPYNDMDTVFEFANYVNDLASSLYQIVTEAVSKDKLYNGIRIGPEFGFEAVRNDKMARAYFRSDGMKFQSGDGSGTTWKDRLYYEYDSETDETILVFDGKFTVDTLEALTGILTPLLKAELLYANKAYITELTVDRLETSTKVFNYNNEDQSDINFIRIEGEVLQFITASYNDDTEQAVNRDNEPLYWIDETKKSSSTEVTDFPVMIYAYVETVRMENAFYYDSTLDEYVPRVSIGGSSGQDKGTGAIYKNKNGLAIEYYSADEGELRQILMNDAGILLTPFAAVGTSALTVDQLETETKTQHYLDSDESDVNYIKIVDQVLQFITASVDPEASPNYVQLTNRDGNPLYWFDEDHKGITTDETDFPVNIYAYLETIKMENAFYYDDDQSEYIPRIVLGAGTGTNPGTDDDYGKGFITKKIDGLYIDYHHTETGELRRILMNDDGIEFTPPVAGGSEDASLISLDFYDNGFLAVYMQGAETINAGYDWELDESGRITSLTSDDAVVIPIVWNSGDR